MRPDDFNMAMRRDLVSMLKDVLGLATSAAALIARIEASIPNSPEESHERTSRTTGECPEASPVDETPSAAGAGAAGPQGTVATISDHPTDVVPPCVVTAEPPAAPSASQPQPAPQGTTFAEIVKPKPKVASKPLDPRPGRLAGVTITNPGTVLSLDMINFVVACPGGDWQTSHPVALIMERMRNGETFGDDVLATLGSMGSDSFRESRKRWTDELAKRGVTFVHTKHVGSRIEVAGK